MTLVFKRWPREFDVAVRALKEAGALARRIQGEARREMLLKHDRSPVTVADFAVQAVVAHRLAEEFPADPLVAEEDAAAIRGDGGDPVLSDVVRFVRECVHGADVASVTLA